jgi:metal-dependent HD superfamily phosphatase/phosphodiesterase
MVDLKLYKGKKHVRVTAVTLFNVVKAITAAGKEAEFLKDAENQNISLEASPATVNFVKTYLHSNKLHEDNAAMLHIVAPQLEAAAPTCFGVETA